MQINLNKTLAALTLDIIGLSGFGFDFHALDNPDSDLSRAYAELLPVPTLGVIVERLFPIVGKCMRSARSRAAAVSCARRAGRAHWPPGTNLTQLEDNVPVCVLLFFKLTGDDDS